MKLITKLKELSLIAVGCIFYALGISLFYEQASLAPGGASGIAVIINSLSGFPVGVAIILINIPLFILGYRKLGRVFILKTIFGTLLSSSFIDAFSYFYGKYEPFTNDIFLCSVFGGFFCAVGLSIIFKAGGSTGGSDIVVKLIRRKRRDIQTGKIFLIVDSIIIISSAFFLSNIEKALYAAVALYITTTGMDMLLYGTDGAKLVLIISSEPDKITSCLLKRLDVGVTFANGIGAYTGSEKKIIICVVKKHLYPRLKDLVKEIDPTAFTIVSSAQEIYGEGYKGYSMEEL